MDVYCWTASLVDQSTTHISCDCDVVAEYGQAAAMIGCDRAVISEHRYGLVTGT